LLGPAREAARGVGPVEAMAMAMAGTKRHLVWVVAEVEWDGSSPGRARAVVKVTGAVEAMGLARTRNRLAPAR
jgi:hypothetical protein